MMQRRQLVQLAVLLSVLGYFLWSAYAQWYDSPVQKARRARAAGVAGDSAESRPPQAAGAESAPASGPRPPARAVAPPLPGAGESEEEEMEFRASQEIEALTAIAVDPITLAQEQRERIGFHSNPFDIVHVAVPTPDSGGPAGPPGDSEGDAVQAPPHEFALTGLYVSWAGDCAAILDGQVVRLEDPVADGWRVAAITEAGIRLRKPGALERFVPKLNPLDTRPRNPTAAPPAAPPGGPAGDGARAPAAPAGSSGPPPGPGAGPGTTPRVD